MFFFSSVSDITRFSLFIISMNLFYTTHFPTTCYYETLLSMQSTIYEARFSLCQSNREKLGGHGQCAWRAVAEAKQCWSVIDGLPKIYYLELLTYLLFIIMKILFAIMLINNCELLSPPLFHIVVPYWVHCALFLNTKIFVTNGML
jgi:hypothetical protein